MPLIVLTIATAGCATRVDGQWIQALGNIHDTTTNCTPEGEPVAYPGWHAELIVYQEEEGGIPGINWAPNFTGFYTVLWGNFGSPAVILPYNGKVINPTTLQLKINHTVGNVTYKGEIYLKADSYFVSYPVPLLNLFGYYHVESTSLNPDAESWIAKYEGGVCKEKLIFTGWSGA